MRAVFIGTNDLTIHTAQLLLEGGHEVIIVESDRKRIDDVSETLDCAFLHGDGSKPAMLREANPKQTELLFCLTSNDRTNIIASLIGRSLGFGRVITAIEDPEFEPICVELGLEDVVVPMQTIGRYLADVTQGIDILELSTVIKGEARFFRFVLADESIHHVSDLDLPNEAQVCCLYRNDCFALVEHNTRLCKGDEIVVLTHSRNLPALNERWHSE
ncbi:MAG: TrkA family potassium uptake protein [Planctomycetales bacterium]|nr:TrkA family potassium uptake protein [Planctomycetales bacterium]